MKQERIEAIFWTLLRAGVSGSDCNLVGYGQVSDSDWQKIYDLSAEQGLTGIVFSAIEKLPKAQLPGMDLLTDWLGQVEYIKSCNEEYRKNAHELLELFRSKGIVPVVLKGEACARYFPDPDRRSLGDLDIFLLEDSDTPKMGGHEWAYEEGNRLASILGAEVELHDYKHSHILWNGLTVENHRLLTTARGSQAKKDFENHLQAIIPSANFEALFLTVHAYQHFMEGELSIRQLCDWAMFVKVCHAEVDWKMYYMWMERLGISRFSEALRWITQYQFAIEGEYPDKATDSERLARHLLDDTLYGRHETMSAENIVRYRIWQTKRIFRDSWKYRMFRGENVVVAYAKMMWNHWFDRI